MKKKVVINVPMHNDRAKSKAMKIAVDSPGVVSVSLGIESDQLVVIGVGVDSVSLANSLRKKFCFANIISVDEVKPVKPETKLSPSPAGSCTLPPVQRCSPPPCWTPGYTIYRPVYDAPPSCSIL